MSAGDVGVSVSVRVRGTAELAFTWRHQWDRVGRSLAKLPGVRTPNPHFDAAEVVDAFVHFFQDAWHLKDWLKNDPASGVTAATVETFATSERSLQLIGDLANASKHLKLTRRTQTGDPQSGPRTMEFSGDPTVGLNVTLRVESRGREHDALDVARAAVEAWDGFLRSHGLLHM